MSHTHDYWESLRTALLPAVDDVLSILGRLTERNSDLYATGSAPWRSYVGTIPMTVEQVELELCNMGFTRNPVASLKTVTGTSMQEDGSWVWRSELLADMQIHVVLFRDGDRTHVFAHKEYSWLTHPIKHYREEQLDVASGVQFVRAKFREKSIPFRVEKFK